MKNKIKLYFNSLLKLIINEYTILVLVAVLALFAINIITSAVMIFLVLVFFGVMFYVIKTTDKKRTYFISFLISCVLLLSFLGSVIYKVPALSYNFGTPKSITTANEINDCLDKGIKVVSFMPKNIEMTHHVQKENISLTGNRQVGSEDGYIKFYYSIVELEDVGLLLKHSENNVPQNEIITGYLSKLDSIDEQVYINYPQDHLYRAIIEVDADALDSNMLSWRIWTILQCVISLMSLILCMYIASKYYRNRRNLF